MTSILNLFGHPSVALPNQNACAWNTAPGQSIASCSVKRIICNVGCPARKNASLDRHAPTNGQASNDVGCPRAWNVIVRSSSVAVGRRQQERARLHAAVGQQLRGPFFFWLLLVSRIVILFFFTWFVWLGRRCDDPFLQDYYWPVGSPLFFFFFFFVFPARKWWWKGLVGC